jgi:hypothetical protein
LTLSRALPGTLIGKIERLGRALHDESPREVGAALSMAAASITRLQRLDVRVFDEDPQRRGRLCAALEQAGAQRRPTTNYGRTLILDLRATEANLIAGFSSRARRNLRHLDAQQSIEIRPVRLRGHLARLSEQHSSVFRRTGGHAPRMDFDAILADSRRDADSALLGAFDRRSVAPANVLGFAWVRLHGDYASYEAGAIARCEQSARLAPGYALLWEAIKWSKQRGASWFDMGGLRSIQGDAEDSLQGILEFKRGFANCDISVAEEFSLRGNATLANVADFARRLGRAVRLG